MAHQKKSKSKSKSNSIAMYLLFLLLFLLIFIGVYFLFAYLIQITFNNSIVPLSKYRISKLSFWNAFALFFLIALLVPGWQGLCYNSYGYYKLMNISS